LQNVSGQLFSFKAQLIQFKVMQRRLITVNIYEDVLCLSTQIILPHLFEMSAFVTYSLVEWCMPLVDGCVDCALFSAVLNVYLNN